METTRYHRSDIEIFLKDFINHWANSDENKIADDLAPFVNFRSNVHGVIKGKVNVAKNLFEDRSNHSLSLASSNHFIAGIPDGKENKVVFSFYLYGIISDENDSIATFGATSIIEILMKDSETMEITDFKFSVNWIEGDAHLLQKWSPIRGQRFWQPGDTTPVIVSELDAPWNKYKNLIPIGTEKDWIMEAYSRYSWAIDQNDIGLLISTFSRAAEGNLTPMGDLKGLSNIIGQIKDFRQPWTQMQHFAEPIKVAINDDEISAHMIVGRIVPQYFEKLEEEKNYAAFYPLTMVKEDGQWKMEKFNYIPHNFRSFAGLKDYADRFI
ncbi:SnoaL-like domain-containing protein [Chishuiella changwenlii]|nr:nuclear transport factor 2 family protein [Chishuiella changwenlii]SHK77486.1 SnoaL-like domain-containing protein [Chishuiella changwenlii]